MIFKIFPTTDYNFRHNNEHVLLKIVKLVKGEGNLKNK
jgi:hypothetical protein